MFAIKYSEKKQKTFSQQKLNFFNFTEQSNS